MEWLYIILFLNIYFNFLAIGKIMDVVSQDDFLYELDVWKVNYEKVISFDNLINNIKDGGMFPI